MFFQRDLSVAIRWLRRSKNTRFYAKRSLTKKVLKMYENRSSELQRLIEIGTDMQENNFAQRNI